MTDEWEAFQVDGLVYSFGSQLSSALREIEGKNKREIATKTERLLGKWLDQEQAFRNPVAKKRGEGT